MPASKPTATKSVTREDIERKLQEIDDIITETTSSAASAAKVALGLGIAVVIILAFASGRRRALRPKTVVSFIKTR